MTSSSSACAAWVPKLSMAAPAVMIASCWFFGRPSKTIFDMMSGSSMNQYDLPRPAVRLFETSSSRKETRLVEGCQRGVDGAGLHRDIDLARRQRDHRRAGFVQHQVHLAGAAADFLALGIIRIDDRIAARGEAAGLPDPGDDHHTLLAENAAQ